jgi:hypothetical protein
LSDGQVIEAYAESFSCIYANMLSLFAGGRSVDEIKRLAVRCTRLTVWENDAVESHISSLAHLAYFTSPAISLKGWNPILLHSLLQRRKGLILCSFRMGPYRFLPLEIALQGLDVWTSEHASTCRSVISVLESIRQTAGTAKRGPRAGAATFAQNALKWRPLNHEAPTIITELLAALQRNEVVLLLIDGANAFARHWRPAQIPIKFFTWSVRVETVIAQLAWHSGAAVLPAAAVMDGNEPGRVIHGIPWLPSDTRTRGSEQAFTFELTQGLYSFLENQATMYPEQWVGLETLHTWFRLANFPIVH